MDWTTILNYVLGGTSLLSVAAAIIYRKQNHRLKENEVKKDNAETQEKEINLAELYKDKMLDMLEQFSQKQESGNQNQERILVKLDKLDERMDNTEATLGNIVTYLNGDFQDYLKRQHPAPRRGRTPKKAAQNEAHADK